MRLAIIFLGVFALSSIAPSVVRADLDSTISDQKEEGIEADDTAMQIHDVESEQKLAREQARAQEQMKEAADKRLKQVQVQRANMAEKYKLDILLSEERRKKAEQETILLNKQIQALQLNMRMLQASKDKAEKAAADAKAISAAGRETLRQLQQKRAALDLDNRHAIEENRRAQLELASLRAQTRKLQTVSNTSNQIK